eukprot:TRINITY_DN3033_c0_g1_i5.p2 TRINITY_DN3033_c0_g1~~TRINITY_DN3033_c0_g1_i5.p2  ORF type:complete len:419 (+),score=33.33 TRINITY_DN3033_c0_g1_i5:186-1442(+)
MASNGVIHQDSVVDYMDKFYRLFWIDFAGVRRCRVVTRKVYEEARETGLGLISCVQALPVYGDVVVKSSGYSVTGVVRLIPVKAYTTDTTHCEYNKYGAFCVTEMMDSLGEHGKVFDCCPRAILKKCVQQLASEMQLALKVGFEHEFNLLKSEDGTPIDDSVYCQGNAFNDASQVLYRMVNTMESCGTQVYQFHAESAPGQFEIATGPYEAIEACDRALLSKDVIQTTAAKFGMKATFVPKLMAMQAGNGGHIHFSINNEIGNITGSESSKHGMSEHACYFVAGILHYLPALCVFLLPSVNSYERMNVGVWSGVFQIWGYENKEAPIRLILPPGGEQKVNVEIKAFDGTTNPYVGVAVLIVAGLAELKGKMQLAEPVDCDPGDMSQEQREEKEIKLLPSNLTEAIQAFESDTDSAQVL